MAPNTSADNAACSQRSILSLDKSEEPFPSQIRTASRILSIHLGEKWEGILQQGDGQSEGQNTTSDPRHSYALRWLLKKLQSAEKGAYSPRLHLEAWILLRELLVRTPLVIAARLLKEHKFVNSLKETYSWLQESINGNRLPSFHRVVTRSRCFESGSDTSSDSSAEQTTARKRKVDGKEIVPHHDSNGPAVVLDTLYVTICLLVKQLEDFIIDVSHTHGYAAEHMQAALKSSPDEIAVILGSSIFLTNHILQSPNRSRRQHRYRKAFFGTLGRLETIAFEPCVSPMIEFWNLRFPGAHGSLDDSQNIAFMRYCMLPILHLLQTLQEWADPKDEVDVLKNSLISLLQKHVALPFRASLGLVNQTKQEKVASEIVFVDALTMSLRNFRFHEPETKSGPRAATKTKVHLTISCLSLLFHIASTCRPRGTPASHRNENPWLESIFNHILTCASVLLNSQASMQTQKHLVRLTKWMLRRALDDRVTLSIRTLETILDKTASLLDKEHESDRVEWGVVSLCLQNDPNVFVLPTVVTSDGQSSRTPNKFLKALFSRLTEGMCRRSSLDDLESSFKLEEVVIRLLHAFANSRNLIGFISHWREQLTIIQERSEPNVRLKNAISGHMAIWEDDKLLRALAGLCEMNLTGGQMTYLFNQAQQNLDMLQSTVDRLFPSIVILDCLVSGCSSEERLPELAESAQLIFRALASIMAIKSDLVEWYQWRLWRIMGAVNDRWGPFDDPQVPGQSSYSAAIRARDLLCLEACEELSETNPHYTDRLHAFNFLLSFATFKDRGLPDVRLWDIMVQAIEKVMDLKESFCRQLREDHFGVLKSLDTTPEWTGQSHGINSIDSLYIGCVARLLQSGKALSCLDLAQQERIFEQLYRLAIYRRTSPQPLSEDHIDYNWLWQFLCRSNALVEHENIANNLQGFQSTQYLNLSGSKDPRYWNVNTIQYSLAFETIQGMPSSAFSKGHRTEIVNQSFRIVLYTKVLSLSKVTEYTNLLIKLIEYPNQKMAILNNASGLSNEDPMEAETRHEESTFQPALVVLVDRISQEPWSVDNVDCFIALRQLTQAVMSHLMSTVTDSTSLQYLKLSYGWLSGVLSDQSYSSDVTPSRSIVIGEYLTSYHRHRAEVPDSLKRELKTLDILRQRHLEVLLDNSEIYGADISKSRFRHYCGTMLETMVSYSDLLCIHPKLRNVSARLATTVAKISSSDCIGETAVQNDQWSHRTAHYLQSTFTRLEYALGTFDQSLHPSFLGTAQILQKMHPWEKADLLLRFQEKMSMVGWQQKEELLNTLLHKNQDGGLDHSSLQVLQRTLMSIGDQQLADLRPVLSKVFMALSNNSLQSHNDRTSIISMKCMNLLLHESHRIVSQCHIDSLLANITIKASKLRPMTNSQQAARCYASLSRLLTTVLARHRSKIGGRYHLLLPPLQSLLRCLFIPYAAGIDHDDPSLALGPSHASGYANLLTTLADPTVSSVATSKNSSRLNLNDETKKARSIAGQHLPYLIMEYCVCQLEGRLTPKTKAALEPGLYAVLGVMTKEGMRTMNAALDESGRAVWKILYGEWTRSRG